MLKQLMNRLTTVPMVGVDLGSAVLKVVQVSRSEEGIVLKRCAVATIEKNDDPLILLKRALKDAGISIVHAAIGLVSPEVVARSFQFPRMPKKELVNAIQLEAEQAILNGHSPSEITVDWHLLASKSKDFIRGVLAVVPKEVIAARLELAKAAGLNPVVVDVEALALWNAYWVLVGSQDSTPKVVLLMNIGARTTNLVIAKGSDELILVRDIQLGIEQLTGGQEEDWISEVSDSLGYARSKGGLRTLDCAYVTGGGVNYPNVLAIVKFALTAPVKLWNPLDQIVQDFQSPPIEDSLGPLLTVAIGLALRQPT